MRVCSLKPHSFRFFSFTKTTGHRAVATVGMGEGRASGVEDVFRGSFGGLARWKEAVGSRSLLNGILPFSLRLRSCSLPGASCALILPAGRPLFLGILPRHSGRTPSLPAASMRPLPRFSLGVQALRLCRRSQAVRLHETVAAVVGRRGRSRTLCPKAHGNAQKGIG